MMWRSSIAIVVVGVVLLSACQPVAVSPPELTATTVVGPPTTLPFLGVGPFVASDTTGIIESATWHDPTGATPALPEPLAEDQPRAILMAESEDRALRIAVNGNGCVPRVLLYVEQLPPQLAIRVAIGEAVPPPGIQCSDILTTHSFEVALNEPASLADITIVASEIP